MKEIVFLLCQIRPTALKYLLIFHQNRQKQNGSKCTYDNSWTWPLELFWFLRGQLTTYFVCTANAHAWMSCILCQYAPARTIWKNTRLIMALNHKQECFGNSASSIVKCVPPQHTFECTTWRKSLECCCIYRNCYQLVIELGGWKGSVTYGLGADISLPPCLATGIWDLAPKATSGPKSRGASFGTTLWHHVQRYCCFGIWLAHAQLA